MDVELCSMADDQRFFPGLRCTNKRSARGEATLQLDVPPQFPMGGSLEMRLTKYQQRAAEAS